jgi:tape measure domain-containing protein
MSANYSTIETRYTANIIEFEKQVQKMAATNERAAKRIEQQALKSSTAMASAWKSNGFSEAIRTQSSEIDGLAASFTRLAPAIAAALTIQGGLGLIEHFTELSNSLKLAGVSAQDSGKVLKQMGQIANDAGVPINSLADLLKSVSQANGDLGLSQAQTIDLTKSVALGMKVSGTDAAAASGAILQLGQALESGTVHAQEFNSVNMAVHPLLVAAAQASTKYGGSVAKMKEDVNKGGLSSKEFARLLIAAQETLSAQTGTMATTQSQALAKLSNSMILYAGQVDANLGVSEKFAAIVGLIADNIDILAIAVAVGATVIGGRMVAAMAAYTVSTIASTAGTFAFAAAMKGIPLTAAAAEVSLIGLKSAGSAVLGIFGGPLGLAITGVTLAVGYLVSAGMKEKAQLDALQASADGYAKSHEEAAEKASLLKAEQTKNTSEIPAHLKAIAALTGEVDLLGNAYFDAAVKAKELILQQDKLALDTAKGQYKQNRKLLDESKLFDQAQSGNRGAVFAPGIGMVSSGKADPNYKSANTNRLAKANNDFVTGINDAQKKLDDDTNAKLATFGTSPDKTKPTATGSKTDESAQALKEAAQIQLAVALANAKTEEDRHKVRLNGLQTDLELQVAEIEAKKNVSAKAKDTLIQAKNAKYLSDVSEENKKYAVYQKAQEQAISDATNNQLGLKLALVTTVKEQHDIALQQLEYAHKQADAAIDESEAYDAATKAKLKTIEQENYTLEIEKENKDFAQKQLDERKDQLDILANLTQFQIDALKSDADLAKTRKERAAYERQALLLQQDLDLKKVQAEQAQLVADKKITEQQAAKAVEDFQKTQKNARTSQAKDNASPLDKYYDEISNFDDAYSNIVVNGLETIDDSISGLIDGTKTWGDVFRSVAAGVVTDILRIVERQWLIKPIAKLLGAGDDSGSASDFVVKAADMETYSANSTKKTSATDIITDAAKLGKMFGIPGFKSGIENFGGGLAYVHADEMLTNLPAGTSVKTAAQTRALLNPNAGGKISHQPPQINQHFNNIINADGVKTTRDIQGWIADTAASTAQQAKDAAVKAVMQKNRNSF